MLLVMRVNLLFHLIPLVSLPTGCENVYPSDSYIRHLLASVSLVLHLHTLQPFDPVHEVRPACLSWILLARHGQRYGQPHYLLLDECQVSIINCTYVL